MSKIEKASRDDWERLGADIKMMYDASVRVSCRACKMFGKSHPMSKVALKLYKTMSQIKSDFDDEAYDSAKHLFKYDELGHLFYGESIGQQKAYMMKMFN